GWDRDQPEVVIHQVGTNEQLDFRGSERVTVDPSESPVRLSLGFDHRVVEERFDLPDPRREPVAYARTVVGVAIKHDRRQPVEKRLSGPPIDIVEIRAQGTHWIQKKEECEPRGT